MIERLRVLLDAPLEPRVARAVIALAVCVTVGSAVIVGPGGVGGSPAPQRSTTTAQHPSAPPPPPDMAPLEAPLPAEPANSPVHRGQEASPRVHRRRRAKPPVHRRQDPQDRRGTPAFRRAKKELRAHRALQHLPYSTGRVAITLVGADHGRAILGVRAASVGKAKKGWQRFLRRFHDSGRSYEPRFGAVPSRGGSVGGSLPSRQGER